MNETAPGSRAGSTDKSIRPSTDAHPAPITTIGESLRQMIAALEQERQALATLDADELFEAAHRKEALCDLLSPLGPGVLDQQTRDLVKTAQSLNDVNRRVRNLLAANVTARLEALGASQHTYSAGQAALA